MIQQHSISNTMLDPSFYQHHHHHSIKEERGDVTTDECRTMTEEETTSPSKTAQEPSETGATPAIPTAVTSTTTAAICAGCGFKIADRYYLVAVDKAWHSECLRCDECRRPLDTALSCFARQSRIYCREDYHR